MYNYDVVKKIEVSEAFEKADFAALTAGVQGKSSNRINTDYELSPVNKTLWEEIYYFFKNLFTSENAEDVLDSLYSDSHARLFNQYIDPDSSNNIYKEDVQRLYQETQSALDALEKFGDDCIDFENQVIYLGGKISFQYTAIVDLDKHVIIETGGKETPFESNSIVDFEKQVIYLGKKIPLAKSVNQESLIVEENPDEIVQKLLQNNLKTYHGYVHLQKEDYEIINYVPYGKDALQVDIKIKTEENNQTFYILVPEDLPEGKRKAVLPHLFYTKEEIISEYKDRLAFLEKQLAMPEIDEKETAFVDLQDELSNKVSGLVQNIINRKGNDPSLNQKQALILDLFKPKAFEAFDRDLKDTYPQQYIKAKKEPKKALIPLEGASSMINAFKDRTAKP